MIQLAYALEVIAFVASLAWVKGDGPYSPAGITAAVWASVFVLGFAVRYEFYPFGDKNLLLWTLWFLISSAGYLVCSGPACQTEWTGRARIRFNYWPLLLLLVVLLAYRIWIVGSTGASNFFFNLRGATTRPEDAETTIGWVGRFYPVIFALFIFEIVYARPDNRIQRLLLWLWMLLYAVATMGKFAIFTPVSAWVIVSGVRGKLPTRRLVWVGAVALFFMLAVHFLRKADGDDTFGIGGVLASYLYGPVIALGQLSPAKSTSMPGQHTFRFLYAIAHAGGFGKEPVQTILDYVTIPSPLNVYTVLQPFYEDFGAIGVALGAAAYGAIYGCLFRWVRAGSSLALVLYAGLGISILTQFFAETLLMDLSGNLQFVLGACAISLVFRRTSCPSTS